MTREWTSIEILLDQVLHDPDLARDREWRDKVLGALLGCPRNHQSMNVLTTTEAEKEK